MCADVRGGSLACVFCWCVRAAAFVRRIFSSARFWLQGGGGPFAVVAYGQYGRFDPSSPVVSGHSAAVLDFEWNPFHDEILASASEDSTIKVGGQQKKIRVALSATSAC